MELIVSFMTSCESQLQYLICAIKYIGVLRHCRPSDVSLLIDGT